MCGRRQWCSSCCLLPTVRTDMCHNAHRPSRVDRTAIDGDSLVEARFATPLREHFEPGRPVHWLDRCGSLAEGLLGEAPTPVRVCATTVFSSTLPLLRRAIRPLWIVQHTIDCQWLPVVKDWRLNERHYRALQGLNKAETSAKCRPPIRPTSGEGRPGVASAARCERPRSTRVSTSVSSGCLPSGRRIANRSTTRWCVSVTVGPKALQSQRRAGRRISLRAFVKQLHDI